MSKTQDKRSPFRSLVGAGLTVLVTWIFLSPPFWPALRNFSYDLPFRFRPDVSVVRDEVVIVYMDDDSHRALSQTTERGWDRTLHAQLVERLTEEHARVIAFDVVFRNADTNNPAADEQLLMAAKAHGKVLFAAETGPERIHDGEIIGLGIRRPFKGLANAERFPCLTNLQCLGLVEASLEQTIRRHHQGTTQLGTLAWKCAQWTLANPAQDPFLPRWVNYYGSDEVVPHIGYQRVMAGLLPDSLTLSNKIVFIGSSATVGPTGGTGKDRLRTPYGTLVPGVDINATTCLNLLRNDWLRGLKPSQEWILFTMLALLIGCGLAWGPPTRTALLGLGGAAAIFALDVFLLWKAHGWFVWMVPCAVQIPCALAWSILSHARRVARENDSLIELLKAREQSTEACGPRSAEGPAHIPDHTLLKRIGRGAYGEVWLARNVVGLYRAVKIVYRDSFEQDAPYEREFRGLQHYLPISLNHPGLLRVLHVGRNDLHGHFFSIMEPADDETSGQQIHVDTYCPHTLAREISRRRRIPGVDCVRIFVGLTEALDYLHRQQLIHRDIKPANIIFVGGAPKLADIGLVTEVATPGQAVTNLGTVGYIAPEGPGSPAADIYSLGKVLYEACMGRDRERFPEFPTTWLDRSDHDLLVELNKILGKACMDDTGLRYASAAQMHADLVRLQSLGAARPRNRS